MVDIESKGTPIGPMDILKGLRLNISRGRGHTMKKKMISLLITIAMIVTMIPMFGITSSAIGNVCKIGNKEYASIADALAAEHNGESAANPTVIKLIADNAENVTISGDNESTEGIDETRYITIDLNNHVLHSKTIGTSVIINNGKLTVTDSTMSGKSKTGTMHYFKDKKCEHGVKISDECEYCATCKHGVKPKTYCYYCENYLDYGNDEIDQSTKIAKKDGCYETYSPEKPAYGTDYMAVQGGCIACAANNYNDGLKGGGIYNTGILAVSNINIVGNTADEGAGIYNYGGNVTITDSKIEYNSTINDGGGVYNDGGKLNVINTTIRKNHSYYDGGGIYVLHGEAKVKNSTISKNIAEDEGGGIFINHLANLTASVISIDDSRITKNSTGYQGGGICVNDGTANIKNTLIDNNYAFRQGGGICVYDGVANVESSTIQKNAANCQGGGILNRGLLYLKDGTVIIENSSGVDDWSKLLKSASWHGGGVYSYYRKDYDVTKRRIIMSGKVIINNNTTNLGNNKVVKANLCLSGELEEYNVDIDNISSGSNIGVVTMSDDVVSPMIFTSECSADYLDYFSCDDNQYYIVKDSTNRLKLDAAAVQIAQNITNGAIKISNQGAAANEKVTITALPNDGYKVESLTVTDSKNNTITINEDNSFTMPSSNTPVTVNATFEVKKETCYEGKINIIGIITGLQILAKVLTWINKLPIFNIWK